MTEMGSIVSTLGGGSGIDMSKLAADLSTAQFALRQDRLTAKSDQLERQISAASSIRNSITTLASSIGDRVRSGDLAVTASVANSSVAQASLTSGTVASGSYTLEVTSLAKSQTLASTAYASADSPVGEGTLTIRFGAADAASFTEDTGHAAVDIDIPAGSTLADVARAINASGSGVSAYVANTSSGAQLVFKGAEGAQNGFVIDATEATAGNGLADLAWQPGSATGQLLSTSADAQFKLDGLAMTSASNKTGEVAPGLSLTLTGTNTGNPTTIGFSDPSGSIPSFMADLVSALNTVAGDLKDAMNPTAGDLSGDPGARALRNALSHIASDVVMPNAADGAPRTLSDLGLVTQRDGTFSFDATRLQETLKRDPASAAAMFTTGLYGIYASIDKIGRSASKTSDPGSLAGSIARYQSLSKTTSEKQSELTEKQETLRQQLVSRFAKADARVAASQSTLTFLKAQIDAWNSSNN